MDTYLSVQIQPGTSSFDIPAQGGLDPVLFEANGEMRSPVRNELVSIIDTFLAQRYEGAAQWLKVWLAGSGASYRWNSATEELSDLDILLGVNWQEFRKWNPNYLQMGDAEIASHMNDQMRAELWPRTEGWKDRYEVTWYVNPRSQDIRTINPYAAYDLVEDEWTVPPSAAEPKIQGDWQQAAESYKQRAHTAVQRYSAALTDLQGAINPMARRDAEVRFRHAVDAAVVLFDTVHEGRRSAFTPTGGGYDDFSNYLWQSGKREGWVPALRTIKDYHQQATVAAQHRTYGMELPDTDTLIRRAALHGRTGLYE